MSEAHSSTAEMPATRRKRAAPRRPPAPPVAEPPWGGGGDTALHAITAIPEQVLGRAGGDWISEQRRHNRARLRRRTEEILRARGIAAAFEASASVAIPLLAIAQDETRDELVGLWAKLLATAFDPAARDHYRREFVAIAAALEPMDVACLEKLDSGMTKAWRYRRESVAKAMGRSRDRVDLALANLAKLGLIDPAKLDSTDFQPFVTPLGREFLAAMTGQN